MTDITPGQTWADQAQPGRTVRIDSVADGKASCVNLTNSDEVQAHLDQVHAHFAGTAAPAPAGKYHGDKRGTTTKIAVTTLGRRQWQLVSE